jgi:hypothetical protein
LTTPPYKFAEDPIGQLRRQQARINAIRKKLDGAATKVTSKDRSITVTIGQNGTLESIEFNTQKFRRMAPAELGSILAETIRQAQVKSRERVLRAFQPVLPDIMGVGNILAGKATLDDFFDNAIREVNEMARSAMPPPSAANGKTANGRKVNGTTVNGKDIDHE